MSVVRRASPDFFSPIALPLPIAAKPASACSMLRSCDPPISALSAAACWLRPLATVAAHSPSLPQSRGSDFGEEHASRVDELLVDERVVGGSASVDSSPAGGQDLRRTRSTNDPISAIGEGFRLKACSRTLFCCHGGDNHPSLRGLSDSDLGLSVCLLE